MQEIYSILYSWAVVLYGWHSTPPPVPVVELKPKTFFIEKICKGDTNCKAVGYYEGGNVVYVWDHLDINNNQVAASVVVHEFVHYLQWSFEKPHSTCSQIIDLEKEAYGVQKEYLNRNGVIAAGVAFTHSSVFCEGDK